MSVEEFIKQEIRFLTEAESVCDAYTWEEADIDEMDYCDLQMIVSDEYDGHANVPDWQNRPPTVGKLIRLVEQQTATMHL